MEKVRNIFLELSSNIKSLICIVGEVLVYYAREIQWSMVCVCVVCVCVCDGGGGSIAYGPLVITTSSSGWD